VTIIGPSAGTRRPTSCEEHAIARLRNPLAAIAAAMWSVARLLPIMGSFNLRLEAWIDERPHEWLCTKQRWPKPAMAALSGQRTG
jgi:hypothetical protein